MKTLILNQWSISVGKGERGGPQTTSEAPDRFSGTQGGGRQRETKHICANWDQIRSKHITHYTISLDLFYEGYVAQASF